MIPLKVYEVEKPAKQGYLKALFRIVIITLFLLIPYRSLAEGCLNYCVDNTGCDASADCALCIDGECVTCCIYTSSSACPPGCHWQAGQCRDAIDQECLGIPELPQSNSRNALFLLAALPAVVLFWKARKRKVRS